VKNSSGPHLRYCPTAHALGAPASSPALSPDPWRSRGYIPHFDRPGLVQSITFRLYDAVPEAVMQRWKTELGWIESLAAGDPRQIELRKRIDKYEDAGHGACWLSDERIAAMVEDTLLRFDDRRYRICSWCVMPNHVHTTVEIWEGWSLAGVLHSWKSYTAHEANKLLDRLGKFWFREYHDRFIRDENHLANAVTYVESNPVAAGLVKAKEEWKWSSASRRTKAGGTPALPG